MSRPEIIPEEDLIAVPLGERGSSFKNLIGQRFERLFVLSFAGILKKRTYFNVKCDCGNCFKASASHLSNGHTRSCGCIQTEVNYNHGLSNDKLYKTWEGIKARCFNPNNQRYPRYGGRGISMHQEWLNDPASFIDWIKKNLGPKPTKNHSLDRVNNDGNYEPGNLRWASSITQTYNREVVHGYSRTPTYKAWQQTRKNCCSRWSISKGGSFNNFLVDMGVRPDNSRLVRLDKTKPYSPSNCEWKLI